MNSSGIVVVVLMSGILSRHDAKFEPRLIACADDGVRNAARLALSNRGHGDELTHR
jgi:hypothetical protein